MATSQEIVRSQDPVLEDLMHLNHFREQAGTALSPLNKFLPTQLMGRSWFDLCMSLAFFGIGFTPITALAVAIIGIVSLPIAALVLVWPAIVLFVVLGILFPAYGKLALKGFVIGLIACLLYDCMRAIFILTGAWGDFIPRIGMWLLNSPRPDWLLGYLWRYIGDGGFMAMAFVVAFQLLKPRINGRLAALLFGLAIWLCLVATILIAPHGSQELFALTPVTLTLSFTGHVIYGVVIGLLLPFADDRSAQSLMGGFFTNLGEARRNRKNRPDQFSDLQLVAPPPFAQGSPPVSIAEAPTAALAKGVLMVRTGPSAGMSFEIKRPRLVIGRRGIWSDAGVNTPVLHLDDPRVSRYHLAIVARPDGVYAHDIGSANGTWINGRQLGGKPARLDDGAQIQVGPDTLLHFRES